MVPDVAVNWIERLLPYKVKLAVHAQPLAGADGFARRARSLYDDVRTLVDRDDAFVVDCGGNRGDLTALFNEHYPQATILTIEANPDLAARLAERFAGDENITILPTAVGATAGTVTFNINNDVNTSTLLTPSDLSRRYHGQKVSVARSVEVKMSRLDDLLPRERTIDLLKLDLEGYELEALKGAGDALERVRVLVTEVQFAQRFDAAPLFADVDVFLRERGLRLLGLYDLAVQDDMQMTAGDAVFVNTRFFD